MPILVLVCFPLIDAALTSRLTAGYGKQGQPVTVAANMFPLRFNKPNLSIL